MSKNLELSITFFYNNVRQWTRVSPLVEGVLGADLLLLMSIQEYICVLKSHAAPLNIIEMCCFPNATEEAI